MPKYLCKASYTIEGVKGVLKEGGTARREAVAKAIEALGGKLEALYWALGETDVYFIVEYPDNVTAVAASIMGSVPGTASLTYTVLVTPEEVDRAAEMASEKLAAYRPPGA